MLAVGISETGRTESGRAAGFEERHRHRKSSSPSIFNVSEGLDTNTLGVQWPVKNSSTGTAIIYLFYLLFFFNFSRLCVRSFFRSFDCLLVYFHIGERLLLLIVITFYDCCYRDVELRQFWIHSPPNSRNLKILLVLFICLFIYIPGVPLTIAK